MFGIFSFIGWLIIGAIIGWIAGKVWVGHGFGLMGNIVVGIVGSIIGGATLWRAFGHIRHRWLDYLHPGGHCTANYCGIY